MPCTCRLCHTFIFLVIGASSAFAGNVGKVQSFAIDDYFKLKRITELALSSDGEMIAYVTEQRSLEDNRPVQTVYVRAATPGAELNLIDKLQNARSLAWIPGRRELAYLLNDEKGVPQLFSINVKNHEIRQHTDGDEHVVKFQFSPDGSAYAWLTQSRSDINSDDSLASLYERLRDGDKGVVVDYEYTGLQHFINPNASSYAARLSTTLRIKENGEGAYCVSTPGQVGDFYWSSDGSKLSIVYIGDHVPKKPFFGFTSIGYFDVNERRFREVARARIPSEIDKSRRYYVGGESYGGGEWIPVDDKLIVRRTMQPVAWELHRTWTAVNLSNIEALHDEATIWREIEIYGLASEPAFIPVNATTIYSNMTVHALPFLYEIAPSGVKKADILRDVSGSVSLIQFTADFETAVFVNESLVRPPEIYIWWKGTGAKLLSNLNKKIAEKQMPKAREIIWKSKDGVTVQGWLLEPVDNSSSDKPWPLITYVHGGPSFAVTDEFAMYFNEFGGVWPYPFKAYALSGIAVFLPNYRGTRSFGDKFAAPKHVDGEPVDDVISGIEYLIDSGIADSERLAISGHSHAAWLGSLIMARTKRFRSASFAEGYQNVIASYEVGAMYVNREVRDVKYGASLYDDPQRYIDLSPALHFKGLDTAVLFEAGAMAAAVLMQGSPKAAAYAGMPTEFVVYPKTGHGMQIPRLQKESAARNLDWFRFWLQDYEYPALEKAEQYTRWRKMRDEQCVHLKDQDNAPWYCRHLMNANPLSWRSR